jgi:hypothetical protein
LRKARRGRGEQQTKKRQHLQKACPHTASVARVLGWLFAAVPNRRGLSLSFG